MSGSKFYNIERNIDTTTRILPKLNCIVQKKQFYFKPDFNRLFAPPTKNVLEKNHHHHHHRQFATTVLHEKFNWICGSEKVENIEDLWRPHLKGGKSWSSSSLFVLVMDTFHWNLIHRYLIFQNFIQVPILWKLWLASHFIFSRRALYLD